MDNSQPTSGEYAYGMASDNAKRIAVIEKRQALMLQALRGEWKGKPEGAFEKAWADCDPPPPPYVPPTAEDIERAYAPGGPYYGQRRSLLGGE